MLIKVVARLLLSPILLSNHRLHELGAASRPLLDLDLVKVRFLLIHVGLELALLIYVSLHEVAVRMHTTIRRILATFKVCK